MDFNEWHLAYPMWLWGLTIIPLIWIGYLFFYPTDHPSKHLESFIDKHLIPFLLIKKEKKPSSWWKALLAWSFIWSCLILALAGPRWNFREVEMTSSDQVLVILLDLSESMNVADIKPSRLIRAKQKIEDFLFLKGLKIGLVAFAADPHMISPITDDKETIRHLLPSLSTDLVYVQGSRLSPALKMAAIMLESEPGHNKAIVIISDGGFEDRRAIAEVKQLADKGITFHAIGMGTEQGGILYDRQGKVIKKNGIPIISKIARDPMEEISRIGKGYYTEQNYTASNESMILNSLERKVEALEMGRKSRFWEEGFLWFLIPTLPIILCWFRGGGFFTVSCLFVCLCSSLEAGIIQDYFMNSEQLGKESFRLEDYESAANFFQDPYRKGVANYKAGNFAEAEKMFQQSFREEVASDAAYNLGNTLAMQQKFKEAVTAYEEVLKKWPEHQQAKENLDLIKKILEQQKKEEQQQSKSGDDKRDKKDDKPSKDDRENDSEKQGKEESTKKESKDQTDLPEKNNSKIEENPNTPPFNSDLKHEKQNASQNSEKQKSEELKEEVKSKEFEDDHLNHSEEKKGEKKLIDQHRNNEKTEEDQDADLWLNRISNDPKTFLKNKFYIESRKNGTKEGIDPW